MGASSIRTDTFFPTAEILAGGQEIVRLYHVELTKNFFGGRSNVYGFQIRELNIANNESIIQN